MRIQLKQHEIEAAIVRYLATQGINTDNKIVTLTFTSGRKGNGLSAEVRIEDEKVEVHPIPEVAPEPFPEEEPQPATVEFTHDAKPDAEYLPDAAEVKPAGSLFG